jgi:D-alanine-D-alanine ligase
MKRTLGVIFGGRSGEHAVSIRSARTVVSQIDRTKYDIVPIAITEDGRWLDPERSAALLSTDFTREDDISIESIANGYAGIFGDTRVKGLSIVTGDSISTVPLDVIFPVLHGTYGEDGTIQGLFEMADIPYVGCGVLASSCGMDKVTMKTLFHDAGLPICRHTWFTRGEWESNESSVLEQVESTIGYPCFVKPANLGSSVGVSGAANRKELSAAIDIAATYDRKVIVEEALDMREIECAVLGNDNPEASRPGEYIIRNKEKAFLDYVEKYSGTGNNEFVVPAPIDSEVEEKIRAMALTAFKAIDGSGLARVDFFMRNSDGEVLVNEINTMPGLTDASGYPKMWEGSGRSFSTVIDDLVQLAIDRHRDKARNSTTFDC